MTCPQAPVATGHALRSDPGSRPGRPHRPRPRTGLPQRTLGGDERSARTRCATTLSTSQRPGLVPQLAPLAKRHKKRLLRQVLGIRLLAGQPIGVAKECVVMHDDPRGSADAACGGPSGSMSGGSMSGLSRGLGCETHGVYSRESPRLPRIASAAEFERRGNSEIQWPRTERQRFRYESFEIVTPEPG